MRVVGCVIFFGLVGGKIVGWCSRNLAITLKLPVSTWVIALDPVEELKDIVMSILSGGTRTLPHCPGAGFHIRIRV